MEMNQYERLIMTVTEFDEEDVITTSGISQEDSSPRMIYSLREYEFDIL